jgi:hypothetical protein|tara:strand:- start:7192 stop:7341 length:150 start_codon:yes stop_codon:yes gene_type:complete
MPQFIVMILLAFKWILAKASMTTLFNLTACYRKRFCGSMRFNFIDYFTG